MLLYQLTQWMEERSSLQKALQSGGEDVSALQVQIDQVEEQLLSQAERWRNSIQAASYLRIPYEAPHLDDDMVL